MNAAVIAIAVALTTQTKPIAPTKAEVVAVAGCVREAASDQWLLTNASDPVASTANAPSPKELAAFAKSGKNEFRLTGVTVFNLPAHRGHAVLVKGLLNKASPVSNVNMTSLTMIAAECPPK
jgi:hypothetical protein